MTVTPLGGGRFEVVDGAVRTLAYGVRRGNETWVFVNGETWVLDTTGSSSRTRRHDDTGLSAPMPATVVAVNVSVGQAVTPGDVLIVLEAMKMEMAITAPYEGRVTAIACGVGDLVQPGIPLLEIEP